LQISEFGEAVEENSYPTVFWDTGPSGAEAFYEM